MGKKKAFINKKNATTFSLIYRSQEDSDAGPGVSDRVLAPADQVGVPDPAAVSEGGGGRWPAGHPLAWLQAETANRVGDDARRREIVSLGLPDDGYDYLKHLRVIGGPGTGNLEEHTSTAAAVAEKPSRRKEDLALKEEASAAPGPSIYVPAPRAERKAVKDVKAVDATKLVLRAKAENDVRRQPSWAPPLWFIPPAVLPPICLAPRSLKPFPTSLWSHPLCVGPVHAQPGLSAMQSKKVAQGCKLPRLSAAYMFTCIVQAVHVAT